MSRLEVREDYFGQAEPGARGQESDVVGYFYQAHGHGFQIEPGFHRGVPGSLGFEMALGFNERPAVSSASRAMTFGANLGWVFRPVPTAVPPRASSARE